jgi:hypothetical protein
MGPAALQELVLPPNVMPQSKYSRTTLRISVSARFLTMAESIFKRAWIVLTVKVTSNPMSVE